MLRRFFGVCALVVFGLLGGMAAQAEEVIRSFEVQATLNADRQVTVEERISYDFGLSERHGIFRVIPEMYDRAGGSYRLRLNVRRVLVDGQPSAYEVMRDGRYVRVKIGDADRLLRGKHVYAIEYETPRSLNDFPDHVEWYWNVTGNDWPVTIERASISVVASSSTQQRCFVGVYGSQDSECAWGRVGGILVASSTRLLAPYEGLTVVMGFPRDAFASVSFIQRALWFVEDNIWLLLPLLTFVLMAIIWRKWGKDPVGRGTIVPQYEEPRNLSPGLQAAMVEERFSTRALTGTIFDLAQRGYLHLVWESESEFAFVKDREADDRLLPFEREIFDGLFSRLGVYVRPSALRTTFFKTLDRARKLAFAVLGKERWWTGNPVRIRLTWILIAGIFTALACILSDGLPIQIVASIVSGVVILAFGWQMPRVTKEGATVLEEIQGFKWFLSVTEKDRLAFSDAPAKRPEQFARFLPAAVALGVERQWAKQFEGMLVSPPNYIQGAWNGWTAIQMAQAVDQVYGSTSKMASPPSSAGSGGSGFSGGGSGGGFGGGGGGSW